jgi:hypothetical protein
MNITIDPEFRDLIQPLSDEQKRQLEENLIADGGARDPLIGWQETGLLVDGHHRFEICNRIGLGFKVTYLSFPDREAAKEWMLSHQLGRRNLDSESLKMLRGRLFDLRAKKQGGTGANQHAAQNRQAVGSANVAKQMAAEYGVSERTIERDARYVRALLKVKTLVPDIEQRRRDKGTSIESVIHAADYVDKRPGWVPAILQGYKVPPGLTPESLFNLYTEFDTDEDAGAVVAGILQWREFGYVPVLTRHPQTGQWILHTLLTPEGKCSRKPVALWLRAMEIGLDHDSLEELCVALATTRGTMDREDWRSVVESEDAGRQLGFDVEWVDSVIDKIRDTMAAFDKRMTQAA